jgi:DNA invertase Pin-like site-specific DNA recombinase
VKLVAYLRVSTDVQVEQGNGLDVQRRTIRAWAKTNGHRIVLWVADEGVSGSNGLEQREGLVEALSALQGRQIEGLVVYRLDRLARDSILREQLLREIARLGGRAFSTSDAEAHDTDPNGDALDPSRRLIRQVLAAVSEYERAMIRLRMRAGKEAKRAKRGFIGGQVPLGFRAADGILVPDDDEQAALRRLLELRAEGLSLRAIGDRLLSEGHQPKRSDRWHPKVLAALLERAGG